MAGLQAFIDNSILVASFEGKIKCPCIECYNCGWKEPKEVEEHLKVDGMCPDYLQSQWKWHGEVLPMGNMGELPTGAADITTMLHDAFGIHGLSPGDNVQEEDARPHNLTPDAEKFYRLIEEGKTELYPGCGKTKLDFILQLYQLKAINCWTDVSFTEICHGTIFRNLCTRVGSKEHFEDLSGRIAMTLCHLERLMPPAFFDVMVHLTIHLAEEAKIAGPVQYRWMYPIERYLHTLKKYVRNRNRPEGSIAVAYIIEETLGFCSLYFGDEVVTKRNRPGRNADAAGSGTHHGLSIFGGHGRSLGSKQLIVLEHLEWERAHRAVLFGCPEVADYIRGDKFSGIIRSWPTRQFSKETRQSPCNFYFKCANGTQYWSKLHDLR